MRKSNKIYYYKDLLNDDFAGTKIRQKKIDANFKFVHKNILWRFFAWIIYYLIAVPVLWFYCVVLARIKVVNKKALKKLKKQNYYLYGNHTGIIDAYIPSLITLPHRNKIVVSPDAVSIKGIRNIVQMVGGLPVPDGISGMQQFVKALEYYHNKNYRITIYPEAHIWPYYTGIRPFKDSSFGYPVSTNSPVIAFCSTFSEATGIFKHIKKANVTVHISEPFYPDPNKPKKEAQRELRDKVYNFMVETAKKYNTFEYITYKPYTESPEYLASLKNQNEPQAETATNEETATKGENK